MGMPGPFSKGCFTNTTIIAPNPSPERWELAKTFAKTLSR